MAGPANGRYAGVRTWSPGTKSRVALRNLKVKSGQMVVLRPSALRYQLSQPVPHTVPGNLASRICVQRAAASAERAAGLRDRARAEETKPKERERERERESDRKSKTKKDSNAQRDSLAVHRSGQLFPHLICVCDDTSF